MNLRDGATQTRLFTLALGVVYLIVGIVGFVPALHTSAPGDAPHMDATASYGYLLGLFPINAFHNIVHLLVGVGGILLSRRVDTARRFCMTLFVVYGVLSFLGFIPQADTVFGLIPIFGNDVWLHAATAIAAAYFGFVATEPVHMEGSHDAA